MVVVILTDCPPALRGDMTKWLLEVNTGVYVGRVSARVRDQIWVRIVDNVTSGRATMVFRANNEQGLDFRTHNSSWEPISFDGLKLMLRPSPGRVRRQNEVRPGFSRPAKIRTARRMSRLRRGGALPTTYLVVDLETTGLSPLEHEIVEIGAIKVLDNQTESEFNALTRIRGNVPSAITAITGIDDGMLAQGGRELREVLQEFLGYAGDLPMVSHNIDFDLSFLISGCQKTNLPVPRNRAIDTLEMARRLVDDCRDYQLATLLHHFHIASTGKHRSMDDCHGTKQLYDKLIEILENES